MASDNKVGDNKVKDYNVLDEVAPMLPASWYYDANQYQAELKAIWQKNWLYLCRADALAEPGAYQTLTIGDQTAFVVRTESGKLAGYHNTCRHRGSVLITEPSGKLRAKTVSCPYHKWCYSTEDGALIATTSFCDPKGFDKKDYGLFPVAVHNWRGFVFVHFDPKAIWDESRYADEGIGDLANFPLEELVVGARWSKKMACNWKSYWDNYNECLHCPHVHPELSALVPIYQRGLLDPEDRPDWRNHENDPHPKYRGGVKEGAETWSKDGSTQGQYFKGLSQADVYRRVTFADFMPSAYFVGHVDYMRVVQLIPLGPEEMELRMEALFMPETLEDPNFNIKNLTDFAIKVLEEDGAASENNQRGMHAAPFERGVLMPEEYAVKRFQDWVRAQLERPIND